MLASPRRSLASQAVAWAGAILAAAAPTARAQTGAAPAPAAPAISTAADIYAEINLAESQEREIDPASPAAVLGAAFDVAEKFLPLTPDEMLKSPVLSDSSRDLLPTSVGRQQLTRLVELRQANRLHQIVDARFAGDSLATLFIVFTPRQTQQPKRAITLDMVRRHDQWQITLDLQSDAAFPLGDQAGPLLAALRAASDRRLAELTSVVAAPLAAPLPFHGTWTTHFAQSGLYLTFDSSGEVFMLITQSKGGVSYGVYEYHLADDEIVIETGPAPIRLKRRTDGNYWEQDGQRYYGLVLEDVRTLFPDVREPIALQPQHKGDWPVRRPLAAAE